MQPGVQNAGGDWQEADAHERALRAQLHASRRGQSAKTSGNPFLTDAAASYGPEGLGDPRVDPFVSSRAGTAGPTEPSLAAPGSNVANDPFMTHERRLMSVSAQVDYAQEHFVPFSSDFPAKGPRVSAVETLLGPGDPHRKRQTFFVFVILPWATYIWVLWVWLLLQHFSWTASFVWTAFIFTVCLGLISLGVTTKPGTNVSLKMLGILCLVSAVVASIAGADLWDNRWQEYWWTQTGRHYHDLNASTPARSVGDASILDFAHNLMDPVLVATDRAVGFEDERMYCAAPILQQEGSDAPIVRVNYWAIGLDCCARYGAFQCDAARIGAGMQAVIMRNGSYPCDGCRPELFQAAVKKAEGTYGFVSANDALLVRWVQDAHEVVGDMQAKAMIDMLMSCFGALVIIVFGVFLMWYLGWPVLAPGAQASKQRTPLLPLVPSVDFKQSARPTTEEITAGAYAKYNTFNCGF